MICFRCGSDVPDGVQQCPNCGQRFAGARKTFTATTTSFRALEKRRIRAAKEAEKRPFAIGDVVDSRYEIRDLIASGPLGTVYRVYDREIEIEIVLKVIHEDLLPEPADRDAFIKAIRRTRKLSQQHIVRIYDAGEEGELCYFTMQYLEGLTLRKVIGLRQEKEQRFTVREVEPIFNQLTMALGHAHRHTVHGDLKPENILILPDVLKVTDFNAFEALPRERFVEAADAPYLAPELRAGQPVDPRADIYSLGVLLYELITGRQYAADGPPPSEVLNAPEEAQVDGVDHLINKATALDPADRYQSAEAFSEALGTYIDAREIASVDIRAREPLLPEDVTRKIAIPVGLRDPETIQVTPDEAPVKGRSIQDAATVQQTPSMLRSVALEKLRVKSSSLPPVPPPGALKEAPAEASYVEELDAYDLIESGESVDIRVPIGLPSPRAVTLPPVDLDAPPSVDFMSAAPVPPTEMSMKRLKPEGPWFLRSNAGFVLSIVVVVGVVVFTALHFLEQRPMTTTTTTVLSGAPDAAAPLPVKVLTPEGVGVVNPSAPDAAPSEAASAPVTPPTPPVITPPTPPTPPSPPPVKETPDKPPVKEEPVKPPVKEEPVKPPVKEEPVKPPVKEEPVKPPVKEEPVKPPVEEAPVKPPVEEAPAPQRPNTADERPSSDEGLSCPKGMVMVRAGNFPKGTIKKGKIVGEGVALARAGNAYCVDVYEYPGAGRPKTKINHSGAEGLCKGAGKRLCTDSEWIRACKGRGGAAYPYGREFNGAKCNTEDEEGDERAVGPVGRFKGCRSAWGAYDMSGNVAEWTADKTIRGGDYAASDEDASCNAGGRASPATSAAALGFRCCFDFTQ